MRHRLGRQEGRVHHRAMRDLTRDPYLGRCRCHEEAVKTITEERVLAGEGAQRIGLNAVVDPDRCRWRAEKSAPVFR